MWKGDQLCGCAWRVLVPDLKRSRSGGDISATWLANSSPVITLRAYDGAADREETEKSHLFDACQQTMQAIIDRAPAATTAKGAAAALDHVLNDDSLWHGSQPPGEVFLRQLIMAARDYIIRTGQG